jgi:CBS domain-containing protein
MGDGWMRPITASDLMNPEVLTVRDDLSVQDLAAFLIENEISGAPVEDAEGRLVGVVSLVDIAAASSGEGNRLSRDGSAFFIDDEWGEGLDEDDVEELPPAQQGLRVSAIMNPKIYSVREDATVSEIASLMLKGHIHRLLVTREDRAVGVITTSDLLGLLVGED